MGPPEIIIIGIIAIAVIFGAKKIPEIARNVGRSSSEFKKGMREGAAEEQAAQDATQTQQAPTQQPPTQEAPPTQQVPPPRAPQPVESPDPPTPQS